MKTTVLYRNILITVAFILAISGCQDDILSDIGHGTGQSGPAWLSIDFTPMAESQIGSRATQAPPGDGMKEIHDICLVAFDSKGSYYRHLEINCNFEDKNRVEGDASNGHLAGEKSTKHGEYTLENFDAGEYYLFAVANMGKYDGSGQAESTTLDYLRSVNITELTKDQFVKLRRTWDKSNYRNNSEMAGYFNYVTRENGTSVSPKTVEFGSIPKVHISEGSKLHCWLRRLASKVTVNFDGTNLSNGTIIYLKEVRLHDIPYDCAILSPNSATAQAKEDEPNSITASSHHIQYCEDAYYEGNSSDNHKHWPTITRTNPDINGDPHSNNAPALFFYENMQGSGENMPSKLPDADKDGVIDSPESTDPSHSDYKDGVKGGTYIEVTAYYESFDEGNEGHGDIIYRFMLGKDELHDYDAERNYHYKLTLKFNGYANDYDWHIEYEYDEEPVFVPNPYYISYGYNEELQLPIQVNGTIDSDVTVKIVRNDWYPSIIWEDKEGNSDYHFSPDKVLSPDKKTGRDNPDKLALGFLSLRKSHHDAVGKHLSSVAANTDRTMNYLKTLWKGGGEADDYVYKDDNGSQVSLFLRTYKIPTTTTTYSTGENSEDNSGNYRVTIENGLKGRKSTTVYIPLYTRQRNILKKTAFTGNNPYDTNQRRGKIHVNFNYTDNKGNKGVFDEDIDIVQVSKVTNPMGVWRRWNNASPFTVTLMHRDGVNSTEYRAVLSKIGGWSAEVEIGKDWILLNNSQQRITGGMNSEISFTIRPKGILSSSTQTRCGIVLVRYHNYSCIHRILVRQGYAPIKINPDGVYWHSANMVTKNKEAESPLDEGSMFRWGVWDYPIDASENVNDKEPWINFNHMSFKDHSTHKFKIAGTNNKMLWENIPGGDVNTPWEDVTVNGRSARLFTLADICKLRDHTDTRYRYGILYGDDATETLKSINEAHGFKGADPAKKSYGMRGCFVYNRNTANNIFLPVGSSGYGHRRTNPKTLWSTPPSEFGWTARPDVGLAVLRYASGRVTFMKSDTEAPYQPLFYDLFRRYGANYWAKQMASYGNAEIDKNKCALDLNYFTFDFNPIGNELYNNENDTDACFVRLVEDNLSTK